MCISGGARPRLCVVDVASYGLQVDSYVSVAYNLSKIMTKYLHCAHLPLNMVFFFFGKTPEFVLLYAKWLVISAGLSTVEALGH